LNCYEISTHQEFFTLGGFFKNSFLGLTFKNSIYYIQNKSKAQQRMLGFNSNSTKRIPALIFLE